MTGLLPVSDAQARLLQLARPVAAERCSLRDAAGRWAARDVAALRSQPAMALSAMDGYALRFADLPGPWTVIGESAAGRPFAGSMGPKQAVRIFTGAAVPTGADTVMVQEEAAREGSGVRLSGEGPLKLGANIRPEGLDFTQGQTLIPRGERFTPARIALAASGGHGTLDVNRRIRVAILTTGDELVPPGTPLTGAQLPEANSAMLTAQIADMPVDIVAPYILPDRLDAITAALLAIEADIIVTIGGASVGDHDLVRPALEAAGGRIDFWRIALRPGKPMLAGSLGDAVILGLPGNPVSAFVTAQLFLRPLIAAMAGAVRPYQQPLRAILGEALPSNDQRQDYLRGTLRDGRVYAASRQDSSLLKTLAGADCLIVRPPHAPAAQPGDPIEILPLA